MQQVNLYGDILKHHQQQSGLKFAVLFLAILFSLIVLLSFYLWWQTTATASELSQVQLLVNQQQEKFNVLIAQRSGNQANPALTAELEHWQSLVNEAAQTAQILKDQQFMQAKGFSTYLKALALRPNPEIWLTAIHIEGHDQLLTLEGSTFKPEELPQTLQKLQTAPALKGRSFAKLKMTQSEKIPGQLDFILSSPDLASEQKNDAR